MKALIVDDDRVLADLLSFTLQREGFSVILAHDGRAALRRWAKEAPDLVILDLNLPHLDGLAVCRRIRAAADTPIVMLTVRGEDDDIVRGLELGADDYITKPFSPRQLVARVQAVLRRAGRTVTPPTREAGAMVLNLERREVQIGSDPSIALTPLESRLIDYLMLNAGHIVTTEAIIDHVWGPEGGTSDTLRQLVRRLRLKIEPVPSQPTYIQTVAGVGYGLNAAPPSD